MPALFRRSLPCAFDHYVKGNPEKPARKRKRPVRIPPGAGLSGGSGSVTFISDFRFSPVGGAGGFAEGGRAFRGTGVTTRLENTGNGKPGFALPGGGEYNTFGK